MQSLSPAILQRVAIDQQKKDFRSFLFIAKGSAAELQTQLILCNRLKLLQEKDVTIIDADVTELLKMITSFISSMR